MFSEKELIQQQKSNSIILLFCCDLISASFATVLSGPFNYVRNMKYATAANIKPESQWILLKELYSKTKVMIHNNGIYEGLSYLQQRLRIGWGTARVGVGMAFGQWIFDRVRMTLDTN